MVCELEEATIGLNVEATYAIIEVIREIEPELADWLKSSVDDLDLSTIKRTRDH